GSSLPGWVTVVLPPRGRQELSAVSRLAGGGRGRRGLGGGLGRGGGRLRAGLRLLGNDLAVHDPGAAPLADGGAVLGGVALAEVVRRGAVVLLRLRLLHRGDRDLGLPTGARLELRGEADLAGAAGAESPALLRRGDVLAGAGLAGGGRGGRARGGDGDEQGSGGDGAGEDRKSPR